MNMRWIVDEKNQNKQNHQQANAQINSVLDDRFDDKKLIRFDFTCRAVIVGPTFAYCHTVIVKAFSIVWACIVGAYVDLFLAPVAIEQIRSAFANKRARFIVQVLDFSAGGVVLTGRWRADMLVYFACLSLEADITQAANDVVFKHSANALIGTVCQAAWYILVLDIQQIQK